MKTCPNPNCHKTAFREPQFQPDGDGQFSGGYHMWHVRCDCGVCGPNHDTKEGAEDLWDKLPRDPEIEKKHKNNRAKIEAEQMRKLFKPTKAEQRLMDAMKKI